MAHLIDLGAGQWAVDLIGPDNGFAVRSDGNLYIDTEATQGATMLIREERVFADFMPPNAFFGSGPLRLRRPLERNAWTARPPRPRVRKDF